MPYAAVPRSPKRRPRRPSRPRRRVLGIGVALMPCLAMVAGPAGASAAEAPGRCPPPPPAPVAPGSVSPPALEPAIPAPPEVVLACIGQAPITGATFNHWAKVARKSPEPVHRHGHHSKPHPLPVSTTIKEVMGFLISSDWVIGEAARLGVDVNEATVKHRFDHIRAQQFPHRREFRKFLRNSGQTIADLLLRVRLNLLSMAIQKRIVASAQGAQAKQQAISEFVKAFKARWKAQTVCVNAFTVADCGSIQEPPL